MFATLGIFTAAGAYANKYDDKVFKGCCGITVACVALKAIALLANYYQPQNRFLSLGKYADLGVSTITSIPYHILGDLCVSIAIICITTPLSRYIKK